jgi:hypothetical protein
MPVQSQRQPVVIKMLSSANSAASLSFPDWAFTTVNSTKVGRLVSLAGS